MTQSKPPALANWMLRHLVLGDRTEAIEGDLLEEFHRGRPAAWYWRQVAGAILASFSSELRADWAMAWTIFFIIAWAYCLYAFPVIGFPVPIAIIARAWRYLVAHGFTSHADPLAFDLLFLRGPAFLLQIVVPLVIYLAGARNLNLRALIRGIAFAVPAILALHLFSFQPVLDYLALHGMAGVWTQLWRWYQVTVRFAPLLAAMWAAQSGKGRAETVVVTG